MIGTVIKQPALFEFQFDQKKGEPAATRRQAERTIAELEILNEKGLSIEQVECFLRALAVLRA